MLAILEKPEPSSSDTSVIDFKIISLFGVVEKHQTATMHGRG
jgi:hypothetical protein